MALAIHSAKSRKILDLRCFNLTKHVVSYSTGRTMSTARKAVLGVVGLIGVGGTSLALALEKSVQAYDLTLHPPKQFWSHSGFTQSLDHASIRRGYEVYKQVCAACHSLKFIRYRSLINVCLTEEEAKTDAAEHMYIDGPDDEGNMFERPGKLADKLPSPYPNEEAARAANSGGLPPDLTYIVPARHGAEDYLFSLLTGYCDPPAGVKVGEDLHYNPYFAGGQISMAKALYNEIIEYSDGTPATTSQLAKDVTTFLKWTSEQHHDDRKRLALKFWAVIIPATLISYYYYRHAWVINWSKKTIFKYPKPRASKATSH